jgi:myosin heavy subunit
MDDLAKLPNLNRDILLKELKLRYSKDVIYVSDCVCVSLCVCVVVVCVCV